MDSITRLVVWCSVLSVGSAIAKTNLAWSGVSCDIGVILSKDLHHSNRDVGTVDTLSVVGAPPSSRTLREGGRQGRGQRMGWDPSRKTNPVRQPRSLTVCLPPFAKATNDGAHSVGWPPRKPAFRIQG